MGDAVGARSPRAGLATVAVAGASPYSVHVGPGALALARELVLERAAGRRTCVIADARAWDLHGARLGRTDELAPFTFRPGEASKELATLERALEHMAAQGLERGSFVVTFGGGVATDLGGLAASLYMRGLPVVHCPTTLLAQVDAAVGGKTAVNLRAGKNLAGTFHQPRAVYADTDVLATLDESELRSGMGEVVKCALIAGEDSLSLVEHRLAEITVRDGAALGELVEACVRSKARVVERDPGELGERKVLNLGHTFAHALERTAGFGVIPHGAAVAVGLALALELSSELGLLEDRGLARRTRALLGELGLPRSLTELFPHGPPRATDLVAAMALDKKARDGVLRFVLPRAAGRIEVDVEVDPERIMRFLEARP